MKKKVKIITGICFLIAMLFCNCQAEENAGEKDEVIFGIPFYFQWDPRWGAVPYGTGVIGNTGCGPTCMAMVAQYLTDNVDYTPEYVADYAADLGCYVPGAGTAWDLFTSGSNGLNLNGYNISVDAEVFRSELRQGRPIILSMGAGDFTLDGHFIVLRGYVEDGFLVNDPNSPGKSLTPWSGSTLVSQAVSAWSFEKYKDTEIRYDLLPGLDEEILKSLMEQEEE